MGEAVSDAREPLRATLLHISRCRQAHNFLSCNECPFAVFCPEWVTLRQQAAHVVRQDQELAASTPHGRRDHPAVRTDLDDTLSHPAVATDRR